MFALRRIVFLTVLFLPMGCGGGGNEADRKGVGAACAQKSDCADDAHSCLAFKGGYCGIKDCVDDPDCPEGSRCVTHGDGSNYCFRVCTDKAECNRHRGLDEEANCSSSVTFADKSGGKDKACVPPSGA